MFNRQVTRHTAEIVERGRAAIRQLVRSDPAKTLELFRKLLNDAQQDGEAGLLAEMAIVALGSAMLDESDHPSAVRSFDEHLRRQWPGLAIRGKLAALQGDREPRRPWWRFW